MPRTNDEVARLLNELATLTEIEEGTPQSFRVRAYRNGVRAVAGLSRDVSAMSTTELQQVRGIGKAIAAKVREYVETGTIAKLEQLRATHPIGQRELMRVPGLGPKTIDLLHRVLGVSDLAGLQAAIEDGRLRDLPGLGEKTAENLRAAIASLALADTERRIPIAQAMPIAERLVADLAARSGRDAVQYAGSLRRFRETVRDLDVLVASDDPAPGHGRVRRPARRSRPSRAAATRRPASAPTTASRSTCGSYRPATSAPPCSTSPARRSTTSACASGR